MAWFVKIGLAFSLAVSSFLGLFHHSQPVQTPVATIASSTPIVAAPISTSTLKVLDAVFSTDGINIYASCSAVLGDCSQPFILQGIDPATFVLHVQIPNDPEPGEYAGDALHLVNRDLPAVVEGDYDISSLEFFPGQSTYLKDKTSVYILYHANLIFVIDGADVSTFMPVSGQSTYDAQDKNHKYLNGQIVQDSSLNSTTTAETQVTFSPSDQSAVIQVLANYFGVPTSQITIGNIWQSGSFYTMIENHVDSDIGGHVIVERNNDGTFAVVPIQIKSLDMYSCSDIQKYQIPQVFVTGCIGDNGQIVQ